jgi:hypothetical protein
MFQPCVSAYVTSRKRNTRAHPDPKKTTPVANPEKLLSKKNPKRTPTTPPTITSSKPSSSTLPKSKGKYLLIQRIP